MAVSMDALLKIKAAVEGGGAVEGLARQLGGLDKAASGVSSGFTGMAKAASPLVSGLQSLIPLATGAGLAAMAKGAIDTADNMNDLSMKTGVAVPVLDQFSQAAAKSGTSVEAVGAAMIKLNRNLVDGKAQEALSSLGINALDASGKLKSADQVMLEVADKFKTMPDGANKTALAIGLFGKAGADMVPLLNMGGGAIKSFASTMTSDFASAADDFNDKLAELQAGVGRLGVQLGTALMPFLTAATDALVAMVDGFSKLPEPVQGFIGIAALVVVAWGPVVAVLASTITVFQAIAALQIGATIAGWLGAIGPAVVAVQAALTGLLAWLTGTLLPGLVAFFSGPVGWTVLAVAAVVAMAIAFREPLIQFASWLWDWSEPVRGFFADLWAGLLQMAVDHFNGIIKGFDTYLAQPFTRSWSNLIKAAVSAWQAVSKGFFDYVAAPVEKAWSALVKFFSTSITDGVKSVGKIINNLALLFRVNVTEPVANLWKGLISSIQSNWSIAGKWIESAFAAIASAFTRFVTQPLTAAWNGIVNIVRNALNAVLQAIARAINAAIAAVQLLINGINAVRQTLGFGPLSKPGFIQIPAFAEGGVVTKPTLAMIGEAGTEYIVPASKAGDFATNYLNDNPSNAGSAGGNASLNLEIDFSKIEGDFTKIADLFATAVTEPIAKSWSDALDAIYASTGKAVEDLGAQFTTLKTKVTGDFSSALDSLQSSFNKLVGTVSSTTRLSLDALKGNFEQFFAWVTKSVGDATAAMNRLTANIKSLFVTLRLAPPSLTGGVSIPKFATGGVVDQPTIGLIGEAGREYIIPERKAANFAANYLGGMRGEAALNSTRTGPASVVVNVTTGNVVRMNDADYVTVQDFRRGINEAVNQSVRAMSGALRNDAGLRRQVGI